MVDLNLIYLSIKFSFINICLYYVFNKILLRKSLKSQDILITMCSVVIAILYIFLRNHLNMLLSIVTAYLIYSIIISLITKIEINKTISLTVISLVISYIIYFLAVLLSGTIMIIILNLDQSIALLIGTIFQGVLQLILSYLFFKIKRFKNGFQFLQNNNGIYENIVLGIMFLGNILILFYYIILNNKYNLINNNYFLLIIILITSTIITWIYIQITSYYKMKQIEKSYDMQEQEILQYKEQVKKLTAENDNLLKIIHETNNQFKAMKMLVLNNVNQNRVLDNKYIEAIQKLQKDFNYKLDSNMKTDNTLPLTNILALDAMFEYMKKEANKFDIEFSLTIKGNIEYMLENYISQEKLEILLGDHIKNSIIAINSSNNLNKRIFVLIGKMVDSYGVTIFDTGIEFEINTLINLGLRRSTTHSDNGGTGIGFMTTFETLNKCGASLIIEELYKNNRGYTKSITILFNKKNEYVIKSNRIEKIKNHIKDNRITLINNIES